MALMRRLLFGALSGVLLAAAFPPYHLPYFLPLAIAALLAALQGATPRQGFYIGIISSGIHTGATLFWLSNLFAAAVAPLCAILSFFPILFCTLWPWLQKKLPLWCAAILWVGLEFYRAEPFVLNFGWPTLGYAVAGRPVFAPFAATLGVYGISFLAFLLGTLKGRTLIIATVLWAVACLVRLPAPSPERPLTITLVQATDEETLFQLSSKLPSSHPKGSLLGGRAGVGGPDIILWPEHAFRSDPRVAGRLKFENYWPRLTALARESKAHLIFGAHVSKGTGEKDFENAAFVLQPNGELAGIHSKNHPVHFITDGIASTTAKAIPTALGRLGVPICFDNDYPQVDRKLVQDGAEVFLVPNMDPDEWGDVQHAQHRLLFAMRAMENGRWLARADVAGGTSTTAPNGVEVAHMKNGEPQTLKVTIGRTSSRTLYSLGGWLFGPLCLVVSMGLIIGMIAWTKLHKLGS
ncbi:MAG: hypothetical protein NTX57_01050 [Armatimonadetes bacterium]|nr:hypothetical protein [Armatimonadota bacterium]